MKTGSISTVETNPFDRADLERQLLTADDYMKSEALTQTRHIKEIITAECSLDLKRRRSYQGRLYVRFLGLGNGTLQSLYDLLSPSDYPDSEGKGRKTRGCPVYRGENARRRDRQEQRGGLSPIGRLRPVLDGI